MGRQSDSNVERTLGHVEPTMGGVMTLTACLTFLTDVRGETFDRATPLRIRFPREIFPTCAVDVQIEDLDISERV